MPSTIKEKRSHFEADKKIYESCLLTFNGVDGWDVYNCSVPFWYNGTKYMYGRVEKRNEWANSHVRLFKESGKDTFTVVPSLSWELEDPYIQHVHGEFILGGTHVRKTVGAVLSYYGFFYRGTPFDATYFTTGPDFMKDVRIVELLDRRVGVFSRKRTKEEVYIGFSIVPSLEALSMAAIQDAEPLDIIQPGDWGGVNQAYLLDTGKIGCIAHYSYHDKNATTGTPVTVYTNYSFVLDPLTRQVFDGKFIGSKACYPPCPFKIPALEDCVFSSGIVSRKDDKWDLYSGVGDVGQGRITIDYPFEGHGTIIPPSTGDPAE